MKSVIKPLDKSVLIPLGDVLSKSLSGRGVVRAAEGTIRAGSKRASLKKV